MSKTSRNFVIAYVLLVGLPILGLVGVLKSGRNLTAPISIDGQWQLQADPAPLAALACVNTLGEGADATLSISQSGKNFSWALGSLNEGTGSSSASSGVIDGTALRASLPASAAGDGGCIQRRALTLVATVNPKADPRSIAGTLSINNCPACPAVAFNAVRVAAPAKKGSR